MTQNGDENQPGETAPTAGAVWIAAYPKSGSTWLRLFVAHLMAKGADAVSLRDAESRVPVDFGHAGFDRAMGIKLADLTPTEALNLKPWRLREEAAYSTSRTIRRTHDAFTLTPQGDPLFPDGVIRRAIHLVRDPRDVAVSFAEYFDCAIDEAIARMADPAYVLRFEPDVDVGPRIPITLLDWSGHCRSWMSAGGFPRLSLRYEDLVADPAAQFTRLAAFAGLPSSPQEIATAVEATRFDRLKARELREGLTFRGDGRSFFRIGRSGGWRTALTPEQARRIERTHGEAMALFGYAPD